MTEPTSIPDGSLIAAALAGDEAAFAQLAERYQGPLQQAARSRLGDRQLAEDAVQEALLCAFRWLHTYDSRYSFRTWLWTILLNQCTRIAQRRNRVPPAAENCASPAAEEAAASPVDGGWAQPLRQYACRVPDQGDLKRGCRHG